MPRENEVKELKLYVGELLFNAFQILEANGLIEWEVNPSLSDIRA